MKLKLEIRDLLELRGVWDQVFHLLWYRVEQQQGLGGAS